MKFKGTFSLCVVLTMWMTGTRYHPAHGAWFGASFEDSDDTFHIVYPERLDKGRARRDLSTRSEDHSHDEHASFKLKAFGKDMVVDIHLNKMATTPQFTLRYFKDDGELIQRQEAPDRCLYQGHVKGQEAESTVILDTCLGLSGLIEDEEGRMYIEPYPAKGKGAHKIYKTKTGKWKQFSCGTTSGRNMTVRRSNNRPNMASRHKREAEETAYKKYLTTKKTRYTELMIIVDNVVYKKYKKDIADVKRRVFTLVNAVDAIYRKINIRVVLSALEIWTDKDHVPFVKQAGEDLRNFENHQSSSLAGVKYDSVHLLRGTMWDDYGGMAYRGEICNRRSLGVDAWNYWGSLGPWLALSHELGHNFNFDHDNIWPTCRCLSPRGCVMGSFKTRVPGFSDCNLHNMSSIDDSCLFNLPTKVVNPKCGNGIPETGEECDCGTPEECKVRDPCCEPNDCRLKNSSQCSDSLQSCCQKCQFSPIGTLCRKSTGECDVPEVCDGKSAQCPPDDQVKDGTSCQGEGELLVGKYVESVKMIRLPQPITARHVRINPQYWERGLCTKIDLLGCETSSSVSSSTPTSIQGFGHLCVKPQGRSPCPSRDGTHLFYTAQGGCQGAASKFTFTNGVLRQHCSGKKICPRGGQGGYGVPLVISDSCDDTQSKFERTTAGKSLRHVSSGLCVHPEGGVAIDGVKLILWTGCDEQRLAFHFLVHDCLVSLGVADSRVISDSRISASSHLAGYPAKEARWHSVKGWCAARKDKNQFVQIDLGQVKRLSAIVQSGTSRGDVTGYFLYYSQDGQRWNVWSSKARATAFCFKGRCVSSADTQCRDLWGSEATSAGTACYRELNVKTQGFGTCNAQTNMPCARRHAKCGQLQCFSSRERPVVDYGSFYELKVLASGVKCRAVSRKGGAGNELVGMVKEGTVCGNNKICVANQCTPLDQLPSNSCPRTDNGKQCAGKGVCTNRGKCHCQGSLDPVTACKTEKQMRDGRWGSWSVWTNCTRMCGGGLRTRHRFCNNPTPTHDGQDCVGKRIQTASCNTKRCPEVHSCQHLLSLGKQAGVQFPDGVYTINPDGKGLVNTYCDMTRDGGGWTLLVTSHTNTWTANNVKKRNQNQPTLNGDFSILYKADQIKNSLNVEGDWFEYRVEANERGRWGGIWRVPRDYTFVATNNKQTNVNLVKKFDNWKYDDYGIEKRMPWISGAKLTTSRNATGDRQWGTLTANSKIFFPAPWLDGTDLEQHPVNIWYWVREQSFKHPRSCLEIQLRRVQNKPVQDGIYTIKPGDREFRTLCKFNDHGGGWSLVLTSASDYGWTRDNVKSRNMDTPSLTSDFSVLEMVDNITDMKHFQYRIEEHSVKAWNGIWRGKAGCSFLSGPSNKSCGELLHQQGDWDSVKANSIKRMPYLTTSGDAVLTSADDKTSLNGAIVIDSTIGVNRQRNEVLRIWLREGTWRSCNEIKTKNGGSESAMKDGVYMIRKNSHKYLPVYCDMASEPGAYTLLVTSASNGWRKNEVKFKNPARPSLTKDYSILGHADQIKALSGGKTFKYRLEANTRGHWGGVWTAPMKYSFVSENNQQTDVTLVKRFDQWQYSWQDSLEKRMPWLGARQSLLTTSTHSDYSDWGSIISEKTSNNPAPWIYGAMPNPGIIWYWVNEDDCDQNRIPVNGGVSEWTSWSSCNKMCITGLQTRRRLCNNPPPRCGGNDCGSILTKQEKQCLVCPKSPIRAHDDFCLQPERDSCNPADNTPLVYIRDTSRQCSKDYMVFTYHDGVLTHKCSGKRVCPQGGTATWQTPLVISSTCPTDASKFQRTFHATLKHKASGFCVHPLSGTLQEGTTAIMWMDACNEDRLKLDLFKLPVYQSPIRAYGGFCLQPASASCNPADNTRLVYHKAARCEKTYMFFAYKDEVLIHTCSGKRVCPQGGTATWETPLVISSTCSPDASKFQRTSRKTLKHKASGFCVHPYGGPPQEGLPAIMWKDDCSEHRLQLDLYMLRGPG